MEEAEKMMLAGWRELASGIFHLCSRCGALTVNCMWETETIYQACMGCPRLEGTENY